MTRSSLPQLRALVRALLEGESADPSLEERLEGAERIVGALAARIQPLVGRDGFYMLLQRALKRAEASHPALGKVRADRDGEVHLEGLAEAGRGAGLEEATAAAEAIVAEVLALLARFIGADMTIRLVRQAFPESFPGSKGEGTEELHDE